MHEAWTPVVPPGDAGHAPSHARLDGVPPAAVLPLPARTDRPPRHRSRHRRPSDAPVAAPADPLLAPWRDQLAALKAPWPGVLEVGGDPLDLPPPPPPALVASVLARRPLDDDTMPLALVPRPRAEEPVVISPETPPRGLRKFDLGSVPASVTPPRSWRKAAWFAVGTSAAVVCGLAVAAVRLVGSPVEVNTIDALPAYPTRPLEIEKLPADETGSPSSTRQPGTSTSDTPDRTDTARNTGGAPAEPGSPAEPASTGSTPGSSSGSSGSSSGTSGEEGPEATAPSDPPAPNRTTIGPAPVTPTDPQRMGDRTEQYFHLVTENPQAAHELCTGSMAREGPKGIEARYAGVDRIEVQDITIDRNQAITTSQVKVVYDDGTESVEQRRLTFTWGGNPKISDDTTTG